MQTVCWEADVQDDNPLSPKFFNAGPPNYMSEFPNWFNNEFKSFECSETGSVFYVLVDLHNTSVCVLDRKGPKFELDPKTPMRACLVHNSEIIRTQFLLDMLMKIKIPIMLITLAGCGKTLMLNEKLGIMNEEYIIAKVPLNVY